MAHLINTEIVWDKITYILISYSETRDMFIGREKNRNFIVCIPSDLVIK